MVEVFKPVISTVANEAHQMVYFLLGSFITFYFVKMTRPPKMKCHQINEFNKMNNGPRRVHPPRV